MVLLLQLGPMSTRPLVENKTFFGGYWIWGLRLLLYSTTARRTDAWLIVSMAICGQGRGEGGDVPIC